MHRVQLLVRDEERDAVTPRWLGVAGIYVVEGAARGAGKDGGDRPPAFYGAPPALLTTAPRLVTEGPGRALQAGWVLVIHTGEWYATVGGDHVDETLARSDPRGARQTDPKAMAPFVWRFSAVEDHWNRLRVRSWIQSPGDEWALHQDEAVGALASPEAVVDELRRGGGRPGRGTVLVGALPAPKATVKEADRVRLELWDPAEQKSIRHEYVLEHAARAAT